MATKVLYLKNDNVLSCTVLDEDGDADTGATVTAVIVDSDGTVVETGLSLTHTGSGVYEVVLDETQYSQGARYTAQITVLGTNSENGYVQIPFRARTRRG